MCTNFFRHKKIRHLFMVVYVRLRSLKLPPQNCLKRIISRGKSKITRNHSKYIFKVSEHSASFSPLRKKNVQLKTGERPPPPIMCCFMMPSLSNKRNLGAIVNLNLHCLEHEQKPLQGGRQKKSTFRGYVPPPLTPLGTKVSFL